MEREDLKIALMAAIPMIAVIALLWSGFAVAPEAGGSERAAEGVIFVNDEPITRAEFEAAMASLPDYAKVAVTTEGGRKALAEQLIRQKLYAQEARRRGLADKSEVIGAIGLARDGILAQRAVEDVAKQGTEQSLEAVWAEIAPEFEQVNAEQIVIGWDQSLLKSARTEQRAIEIANDVSRRARSGEDFDKLRAEFSDDKRSDGTLGTLTRESASEEIVEPLFALKDGEVSEPVRTDYGWHVFRMISKKTPSFEEVRPTLEQDPGTALARAVMRRLRDGAEIRYDDDFFRNPFDS